MKLIWKHCQFHLTFLILFLTDHSPGKMPVLVKKQPKKYLSDGQKNSINTT